jgi:thymidylate kinase
MGHIPKYEIDLTRNGPKLSFKENPLLARILRERENYPRRRPQQDWYNLLKKTASESRVIIIEGVSGSGKDTFQSYFRSLIEDRDIYDYSEGELMQSWKQLQIQGIFSLRVRYMRLFIEHVKDTIDCNHSATFLLNRFHLSTYASTIVHQPKLQREYDKIINILKTLPVHIFILRLDQDEMEKRSQHPERSTVWRTYQKQIVKREGFRHTVERHVWQQELILQTAEKQQLPYSLIKLPAAAVDGDLKVPENRALAQREQMTAQNVKLTTRKGAAQTGKLLVQPNSQTRT